MEVWKIILICVFSVIGAGICLSFALAIICDRAAFGKRYDKNPNLKYFNAEDFNLSAQPVSLKGGLNGYIYRNEQIAKQNKTVVFVHGMGAGHLAYTTEIAYFANLGYPVIAIDSKGCNLSNGKNIGGMYDGVKTAVAAVDFAKKQFPQNGVILIGHSWGGYSVLCAATEREVEKVVAISAPSTPVLTLYGGALKYIPKFLACVLRPYWYLINFLKYGKCGNANAIKSAQKSGAEILLVHGDKDGVVSLENAAYSGVYGKHVTKFLAVGKAHNPYNTVRAEKELARLSPANFDIDFKAATEEDNEIMTKIAEFLQKNKLILFDN